MKKLNACISVISSRTKCLKPCLKSLWDKYNYKHDYPVYVYYFDDIYDSEKIRNDITSTCTQNVTFKSIPYKTPDFLKEEDLFYNRKDNWYARTRFPINRKGYLHMCHFMSNFYGYPNTDFEKYDYAMSIDDESAFVEEMPYDPFQIMKNRTEMIGALKITDQTKKKPHQGNFDTRVHLWDVTKKFIEHYGIIPSSSFMKDLLEDPEADKNFHLYPAADSYVIKLDVFKTKQWKMWINAVNSFGGIYKYRWGDNDVISIFYLIFFKDNIYDLKTVDDGYHVQNALRHLQDYAPGVKDNSK